MSSTSPLPAPDYGLTIVVPAFNEEGQIAATLTSIQRVLSKCPGIRVEVLVINDGSCDGTAGIVTRVAAQNPEVKLVSNPRNLGLGSTIQVGISRAAGKKLVIVPGDNDLPETTLGVLIRHSREADMVMCYFIDRELRGRRRNVLSAVFGLIYTCFFDVYLLYINGPCVYPVDALRRLTLFSTRFSIVAEINVKLLRQGASFIEVPSFRQTGMTRSRSFSIRNLWEAAVVFTRLCYEIHIRNRSLYSKRPTRVLVEVP